MTVGHFYGIAAKNSANSDPFNTWSLVPGFIAEAPDEEVSGAFSVSNRFLTAVDLDAYVGPTVSVLSPASGATVCGNVSLQVHVTDILPLGSIQVFVDGTQVAAIQPGGDGAISLPTSWFPNGEHEIWVAAVNVGTPVDTDGDGVADDVSTFQQWGSISVHFANDVAMQNYSPLYSSASSITLRYNTTAPQDYTFEVFSLSGSLLHTATGESVNGSIDRQWNYTDLLGNHLTDPGYVFSLTCIPKTGGLGATAAHPHKIITTNIVDKGVTVGRYAVSYGTWPWSRINNALEDMNRAVSIRINTASYLYDDMVGEGRDDYNLPSADFSSAAFQIRQTTQLSALLSLTNAIKNASTG